MRVKGASVFIVLLAGLSFLASCNAPNESQISTLPQEQDNIPKFPLEGKVILSFQETAGEFYVSMATEKIYGICNYRIKTELTIADSRELRIHISHVYNPSHPYGNPMFGPAIGSVYLGKVEGAYRLTFSYDDMNDDYPLDISPEKINLYSYSTSPQFTKPSHYSWHRLSPDTIWIITTEVGRWKLSDPNARLMGKQEYKQYVDNFFNEIEALGAKPFIPKEGYYPYWNFFSPSSIIPDDYTLVDIRYYKYNGSIDDIRTFIESKYANGTTQMWVKLYNTEREFYPGSLGYKHFNK